MNGGVVFRIERVSDIKVGADLYYTSGNVSIEELAFGLQRGYLSRQDVVEVAIRAYQDGVQLDWVVPVASLFGDEPDFDLKVESFIKAKNDDNSVNVAQKWLFILVAWTYINRNNIYLVDERDLWEDSLELIAWIWAEFGSPDDLRHLIYYLPRKREAIGKQALFRDIFDFLRNESLRFGGRYSWFH